MNQLTDASLADGPPTELVTPPPAGSNPSRPASPDDVGADLLHRLDDLERLFASTLLALDHTSRSLRDLGVPPDFHIVSALGECHRQFLRLRLDITRLPNADGHPLPTTLPALAAHLQSALASRPRSSIPPMEPLPTPPALPTPDPIPLAPQHPHHSGTIADEFPPTEAWDAFDAFLPNGQSLPETVTIDRDLPAQDLPPPPHHGVLLRDFALNVLDRVLALTTRDGSDFAPLHAALERARSLRDELDASPPDNLPPETVSLVDGTHPFVGLLRVVDGTEELADSEWSDLHAAITDALGRPLAIAAARHRLTYRKAP